MEGEEQSRWPQEFAPSCRKMLTRVKKGDVKGAYLASSPYRAVLTSADVDIRDAML